MFSIFKILRRRSRLFYFFIILLGILTSASNFGMIYIINRTITFKPIPLVQEYSWVAFIVVLCISFISTRLFQRYLIKLVNDVGYDFTVSIFDALKTASWQKLEAVSREKVYTAMDDVDRLSSIPVQFLALLHSVIILMCGFVYMFSLSFKATISLLGMLAVLSAFLIYRNRRIRGRMREVRELENNFYKYLNDLLNGFREILMSVSRTGNLHEKYILNNRRRSRDLRITTSFFFLNNEMADTYGWYIIIGAIVFGISRFTEMGIAGAVSFTFIVFYIMGPIGILIRFMPVYMRMKISYEHLKRFMDTLGGASIRETECSSPAGDFQSLGVEDICYEYQQEQDGFSVGPLTLEIGRGEVVFITGGNGSGKSTFVHLIAGIFQPSAGKVYYNGQEVDTSSPDYRNNIAVIFTDPYLFAYNYEDFRYRDMKADLEKHSTLLKMNDILKVDFENDYIGKELSKGQQKRLALILALLEKKPVIVMDEWAAEQDPQFRRYFYRTILPSLKAAGKTLLLITHDDQYFDCADRVLKFEYGKIAETATTVLEYDK